MTTLKIINNSNKNGQIVTYLIDPLISNTTTTKNSTSNNELSVSSNNNVSKVSPKLTTKSKSMTHSSSLKRILKSPFTKRRNTASTSSNLSANNNSSKNKSNSNITTTSPKNNNNSGSNRRRHSSVDQIEKSSKTSKYNNNNNNGKDNKKINNSQSSLKHHVSSLPSSTKQVDILSTYTTQSSSPSTTSPIILNKQHKSNKSTSSISDNNFNTDNHKKTSLMRKLSSKINNNTNTTNNNNNNNTRQSKKEIQHINDGSYDVNISIKQQSSLILTSSQQEETKNNLNIEVAKKVFDYFDDISKGYVTVEDVENVIKKLDYLKNEIEFPNEQQINDSFNIYCKSEKGKLNFIEFTEILNYGLGLNEENDEMIYIFRQFDLNNDGIIERHELKTVMQYLFPDDEIADCDIDRMLIEADLNKNGSIDYYEFGSLFRLFKSHINVELDKTRELVDKSFKNCGVVYQINNRKMQTIDLKEAFSMFDKNGDNKISPSELEQVMKYLGLNPNAEHVKNMIKVVDTNGNGFVDYDEFISMMTQTKIKPKSDDDELKEIFKVFDIDGNGFISAEEIKRKMADLGIDLSDHDVTEMIKAADINHDGQIDLHEFTKLLESAKIMSK